MMKRTLFDCISDSQFNGVRVYLSGTYSVPKTKIVSLLEGEGAIVRSKSGDGLLGLAKATCVIIAGKNQSEKDLEKIEILSHDGFHIPIINEMEMNNIISGKMNVNFELPVKKVDITYNFIFNSIVPKILHFNFHEYTHDLGQRELFLHDIRGDKDLLYQSLGNIGAYTNFDFDPAIINYCWLKQETIDKLKNGEKDDFIKIITDKYNNGDGDKFIYKFIVESEAIAWMDYRSKAIGDKISLDLISRYQKSIYDSLNVRNK